MVNLSVSQTDLCLYFLIAIHVCQVSDRFCSINVVLVYSHFLVFRHKTPISIPIHKLYLSLDHSSIRKQLSLGYSPKLVKGALYRQFCSVLRSR
jgi:hypothetical protein